MSSLCEPRHDKTNKISVHPVKTQISLGTHPVWSESSLCTQWVAKDPRFLHADSKDSDQTGRMPRLIWVFAGRTCHFAGHTLALLVLSRIMCCLEYTIPLKDLLGDVSIVAITTTAHELTRYILVWFPCLQQIPFLEPIYPRHLSLITRKPVFRVSDQVRLKLAWAATETRYM